MKSLRTRILENNREEEIQQYLDIISMNPKAYGKYIDLLRSKYGVDFYELYNDKEFIKNASLKDLKSKKDFMDYDNYIKYAQKIFQLRKISTPQHIYKDYDSDFVRELGKKWGFGTTVREYTGTGNVAEYNFARNTITTQSTIDVNTLIHELGHWFDHTYKYEGLAKNSLYASSSYMIRNIAEVFAENFMHYFIAPKLLKKHLPEVYTELDRKIPNDIKKTIHAMM